jgi:hypothetical protein
MVIISKAAYMKKAQKSNPNKIKRMDEIVKNKQKDSI